MAALWIPIASAGLAPLVLAAAAADARRYALVLVLTGVLLALHAVPAHKEYRFVFALIPLWLLIASDLVVRTARHGGRIGGVRAAAACVAVMAAASGAGLAHALPLQWLAHQSTFTPLTMRIRAIGTDPLIRTYDWLRHREGVEGVWHRDAGYTSLPGYYRLHRPIPWYDELRGRWLRLEEGARAYATHIVTAEPDFAWEGWTEAARHGSYRVLERSGGGGSVERWREQRIHWFGGWPAAAALARLAPGVPPPAQCAGIVWEEPQGTGWCTEAPAGGVVE